MRPALEVTTFDSDGAVRVVARGELDIATAPILDEALGAAEITGAPSIILDIEQVSFIDSTGLRSILQAHARSEQDGNRFRLTKGTVPAQRLFALVGVDTRLPFAE